MLFWNKICGLILAFIMLTLSCSSQKKVSLRLNENTFLLKKATIADSTVHVALPVFLLNKDNLSQIIPADFSTCKYGFFCKQELIVEKAVKFPLRVRLGSLQQCNYYEEKR